MALPSSTLGDLLKSILSYFRTSFPGLPLGVKRFLGRLGRAVGLSVWGLHAKVEAISNDIVPNAKASDDSLTEWAFLSLKDGQDGYGRLLPTAATGGEATLTGVQGTSYSIGLIAVAEDGTTQIQLDNALTIAGSPPNTGSVSGALFSAVTAGSVGNLAAGSVCTWQAPPAGADPSFTLSSGLSGGADLEGNPAVFSRLQRRFQTPPRGGAAEDYREWAEEGGAREEYVYPRRQGTGTVDVVVAVSGSGQNRRPPTALLTAVQESIDSQRPAAVESSEAMAPDMPDDAGLDLRVRVVPSKALYAFEWDDTAGALTVAAYTPGSPSTLELDADAPASLVAAIDAANLSGHDPQLEGPRLQVISSPTNPIGDNAINGPVRVVGYSGSGNRILTLQDDLTGFTAPTVGDPVYAYAGGNLVPFIAQAILDKVNSLGPSRVSGYADPQVFWRDTLALSNLITAAEDTRDTDGFPFVFEVLSGGAFINGLTEDYQAQDFTTEAPRMLYARTIAVTQ